MTDLTAVVCIVVKKNEYAMRVYYPISMNFRKMFYTNNVYSCMESKAQINLTIQIILYNVIYFVIRFFSLLDKTAISLTLSDNLSVIFGGTFGACVIVIIGVVLTLFVIRYES